MTGEETSCPKREDGQHCGCWYDGGACCACGDDPMHPDACDCDRVEKHLTHLHRKGRDTLCGLPKPPYALRADWVKHAVAQGRAVCPACIAEITPADMAMGDNS